MGRKNKSRKNKGKNNKWKNPPLAPLDADFKQQLYLEALEGINLLKASKDVLLAKNVKEAFILSKQWLDNWKLHVGYDAVMKGDNPGGRKYGRQQILEMNLDLLVSDTPFHDIPNQKYMYLDPPMTEAQPGKDFIIVNDALWEYFFIKYGGKPIIRIPNEKGEFNLKYIKPQVIFMSNDKINEIQNINQAQILNNIDILQMKKLQMLSDWSFKEMRDYCNEYLPGPLDIFLIQPTMELNQARAQIIKSINQKKYQLIGVVIDDDSKPLNQFLKSHFLLMVCEKGKFEKIYYEFQLNGNGICYKCGSKGTLNSKCACLQVYYCSDSCKYKDQEFHSNQCNKAYDSDDDQEFDDLKLQDLENVGAGLVNMGNTCYMNSSLQSLFSLDHLREYLVKKLYWQKGLIKKQIQLNYKLEKLMKILCTNGKAFSPFSFRQQLSRKYATFGTNYQQDAAEFLLYLLDALNEELIIQNDDIVQIENTEQFLDVDQPIQENSDNSSDDEGENDETQKIPQESDQKQVLMQYRKKGLEKDINDFNSAWEIIQKNNSQLIINNFMGVLQSEILCPLCEQKTKNFESFTILPLQLEISKKQLTQVDVYIIFEDWFTPYAKKQFNYDQNTTLMMDLKREIGEEFGILPTKLMGAVSHPTNVSAYLFHDEDKISKILKEYPNLYLCLFEQPTELHNFTENDQYFDIQLYSFEKKSTYSVLCENIPVSIPKLMIFPNTDTSTQIYQKIFHKLKEYAHSDQIIQLIPEEPQQKNLLTFLQVKQALKYQIYFETKLPAKTKCPFSCDKHYKKELKCHSCEFPFNNSTTLVEYLNAINYKDSHTSFMITFDENCFPQELRSEFPPLIDYNKPDRFCQLESLIENFQTSESLQGENAYYCSTCQDLTFAMKQMSLAMLPTQLIIQLKRFQFEEHKAQFAKNNIQTNYPEQLVLQEKSYSLQAVILHYGGLDNGHYVAFGKRMQEWHEFNDEKVHQVDLKEVLNNKSAYILFYQQE